MAVYQWNVAFCGTWLSALTDLWDNNKPILAPCTCIMWSGKVEIVKINESAETWQSVFK